MSVFNNFPAISEEVQGKNPFAYLLIHGVQNSVEIESGISFPPTLWLDQSSNRIVYTNGRLEIFLHDNERAMLGLPAYSVDLDIARFIVDFPLRMLVSGCYFSPDRQINIIFRSRPESFELTFEIDICLEDGNVYLIVGEATPEKFWGFFYSLLLHMDGKPILTE